jgi:hypothetical protein
LCSSGRDRRVMVVVMAVMVVVVITRLIDSLMGRIGGSCL